LLIGASRWQALLSPATKNTLSQGRVFFIITSKPNAGRSFTELCDLHDFRAGMILVADGIRRAEFKADRKIKAFDAIKERGGS
jgi:hypothetical protein